MNEKKNLYDKDIKYLVGDMSAGHSALQRAMAPTYGATTTNAINQRIWRMLEEGPQRGRNKEIGKVTGSTWANYPVRRIKTAETIGQGNHLNSVESLALYESRRNKVLEAVEKLYGHPDKPGGYESYQFAKQVHLLNDLKDRDYRERHGISFNMATGEYHQSFNNTMRPLLQTFNRHGEEVGALLESDSLRENLNLNVLHMNKDRGIKSNIPVLNGRSIDYVNLSDEVLKNFVLTGHAQQEALALESYRVKASAEQHQFVIKELMEKTKEARQKGQFEHIKLTDTLKQAFDHKSDTIDPRIMYAKLKSYLEANAIANIDAGRLRADAPLSSMESELRYAEKKARFNQSEYLSRKKFEGMRASVTAELFELRRDIVGQVDEEFPGERKGSSTERFLENRLPDPMERLHLEMEADQEALEHINKATQGAEGAKLTAMKRIMNEVTAASQEEIDITNQIDLNDPKYASVAGLDNLSYKQINAKPGSADNLNEWLDYKKRMDDDDLYMRRKGDVIPYRIESIDESGMIVGRRLAIDPSRFDMKINFGDIDSMMEQLTAQEGPAPIQAGLSAEEIADINRSRAIFIQGTTGSGTVTGAAREFSTVSDPTDLVDYISRSNQVRVPGNLEGRRVKMNEGVLDIIGRRAGWMLSGRNEAEMLKSDVDMALYQAALERKQVKVNVDGKLFDKEFEDSFVKNLHRNFFEMNNDTDAVDNLIRNVAEHAESYIPDKGDGRHLDRLANEISYLLGENSGAGNLIRNEFTYYRDAMNPARIKQVLSEEGRINVRSADYLESFASLKENGGDAIEIDEADFNRAHNEIDLDTNARINDRVQDERKLFRLNRELNTAFDSVSAIQRGDIYKKDGKFRNFKTLRQQAGDDFVDEMLWERHAGLQVGNRVETFQAIMNNWREKYGDDAVNMMRGVYNYEGTDSTVGRNLFRDLTNEISVARTNGGYSDDAVRNAIRLSQEINGSTLTAKIGSEQFALSIGKDDEIIARSMSSNMAYEVTADMKDGLTNRSIIWSTSNHMPDPKSLVSLNVPQDMTNVGAPSDALPLGTNPNYNVNRVNAKPGGGYLSSSDVGTLSGVESLKGGRTGIGYDFETTGFVDDPYLSKRGMVLPTEFFGQDVQWENGALRPVGAGSHAVYDVGKHQVGNVTVNQMMTGKGELGGLKATSLINEVTGSNKRWANLSPEERVAVMNDSRISFMRNLAKYSPALAEDSVLRDRIASFNFTDADGTKRPNVPDSLTDYLKELKSHAKGGLKNLSNGLGIGADVYSSLDDFMERYHSETGGKVHILQNGADADLQWVKEWDKQVGRASTKPEMIEAMHLSRMNEPGAGSHSIENRMERSREAMPEAYRNYKAGSHLADVDTRAMLSLVERDINELGDKASVNWLRPGDIVAKFDSTGDKRIPHDVYRITTNSADELLASDGGYRLNMETIADGVSRTETIHGNTLQQLQMNLSNNYKKFGSMEEANQFLDDLSFDDAREDVSTATTRYNRMVQEYNRANGTGVQNLKGRYDELAQQLNEVRGGNTSFKSTGEFIESLNDRDKSILANQDLFEGERYQKTVAPEISDRMQRAMDKSGEFFRSEDARYRMKFMGDLEDMKAAGVIDEPQAASMLRDYNNSIRAKAESVGVSRGTRAVPGLVDIGTLGQDWGPLNGTHLTGMANTYSQAEQSIWGLVNKMKPISQTPGVQGEEWKQDALRATMRALKDNGIINDYDPANPSVSNAANGLLDALQRRGPAEVENNLVPYIQGEHADVMRQAYEDARVQALMPFKDTLNENGVARDIMARNRALRNELIDNGELASGMRLELGARMSGARVPLGDVSPERPVPFAGMDAHQIHEIARNEALDPSETRSAWKELLNRATKGYTDDDVPMNPYGDSNAARGYLGWQRMEDGQWVKNAPSEYIHPLGDKAGTRYADLQGLSAENMLKSSINRNQHPALTSRISEFVNSSRIEPSEVDDVARNAINRALNSEYVHPDTFNRLGGANLPESSLLHSVSENTNSARMFLSDMVERMRNNKLGLAIGGSIAVAGFVARQWTKENQLQPENRPHHDTTPDSNGAHSSLKNSSSAYNGPDPSGKTYLTEGASPNYNIQINARNPGHVNQDAIGDAVNSGMAGRQGQINVNHRDDRTTINREWLQQEFGTLLQNGYVG